MNLPLILLLSLVISNSGSQCIVSSDDFAVETVIEEYNLFEIQQIAKQTSGTYYLESEYSPDLIVLLKETSNPSGLSVRLQIPTEISEVSEEKIRIVSTSSDKTVREKLPPNYAGWKISCESISCQFIKEDLTIISRGYESPEITLEIDKELNTCDSSCRGVCFSGRTEAKCIDQTTKIEIETILKYSNISDSIEDLFESYRLVGSDIQTTTEIEPTKNTLISWQEAMRQELVYLRNQGAISLERESIESISSLAKRGQAGQNYRIVYDKTEKNWNYYNSLSEFIPTNQLNCNTYELKEEESLQIRDLDLYYLIPIGITAFIFMFLFLLIIIAIILNRRKPKKEAENI